MRKFIFPMLVAAASVISAHAQNPIPVPTLPPTSPVLEDTTAVPAPTNAVPQQAPQAADASLPPITLDAIPAPVPTNRPMMEPTVPAAVPATQASTSAPATTAQSGSALPKIVPMPQPFAVDGKEIALPRRFDRYSPDEEMARLMEQPPGIFIYNDADFITVLRALADQARMSFIVPPALAAGGAQRVVTCAIAGVTPFEAMQNIAESQGFNLDFKNGIWLVSTEDDSELIAKTYQIHYNPMEVYDAQDNSGGGGGGGGSSSATPTGLPDGGIAPQFSLKVNTMFDNIKQILAAAPTGGTGAPQLSVGGATEGATGGTGSSQVVYNPDESSFFVMATQRQHKFVADYIANADKPMKDIAIEAKFFETDINPKKELGFDWSSTFGGDGFNLTLSDLTSTFDLNDLASTFALPQQATLTASDVNVAIKALLSDSNTELVSYPRVVTTSNREVVIRSVVNIPILASNTQTQTTTTTDTQQIEYLPVGTVINVLPKLMPNGAVRLRVTITVSTVTGETIIQGNNYPITSSRVYSGEAVVNSGSTLAIAGLEETKLNTASNKVAALGDIPFFGYFFRSRTATRDHRNLMFFITPTVLSSYDGGLKLIPDTEDMKRAEPNNPDTTEPNWRNWTNPQYLANDTPIGAVIDEGLLNAIQNKSPDAMVHSTLFGDAVSGPKIINPVEYPFNKATVKESDLPNLDPTPNIADAKKWPLELVERYLNYYKTQAQETLAQEDGYEAQLQYLKSQYPGADRNKLEVLNDRRAKVTTAYDSTRSSLKADVNAISTLLNEKLNRYELLIKVGELYAGNRKVDPSTDALMYVTREEMSKMRHMGYGNDKNYQRDFMTLLNARRNSLNEQIQRLSAAQNALNLPNTTAKMAEKLNDLTVRVDAVEATW